MRRLFIAATLALGPVAGPMAAQAEPSPISAEVGANGIAPTAKRLATLSNPTPEESFALAGLRFLGGVESALQLRWQTGVDSDWSELPIMRLPIPDNPAPRGFTGKDMSALLTGVSRDMEATRSALTTLGDKDFGLVISLGDLWFDIDGNGKRTPGEGLGEVAGFAMGLRGPGAQTAPEIRFDGSDAAWLSAYSHLLAAFSDVLQAYDPAPVVDRIIASGTQMKALWGETQPNNAYDYMFGSWVDRAAIVLQTLAQQPDATLTGRAHAHLLSVITENRRFWTLVEAETDNDREWIPNDRQTAGLGIEIPKGAGAQWQAVLADAEKMLKGEVLVAHWRYGADAGIDVARLFAAPPRLDLVGMIQGESFLPYARKGPLMPSASWDSFLDLTQGDAMLFAVLFN